MAIVFGSPEANEILWKDRLLWKEEEAKQQTRQTDPIWRGKVKALVDSLNYQIEDLGQQVGELEDRLSNALDETCPITGIVYRDIQDVADDDD